MKKYYHLESNGNFCERVYSIEDDKIKEIWWYNTNNYKWEYDNFPIFQSISSTYGFTDYPKQELSKQQLEEILFLAGI